MKKLLSICLLVVTITAGSSFTTNSERSLKQTPFLPRVYWTINHNEPILGTNCTALIHFSGYFDWNHGQVTNVTYNPPTVTVSCGGGTLSRIVYPDIATLNFDSNGHVSELEFSKTEDGEVDGILSDPDIIADIIDEMNDQIDPQL